MKPRKYQTEAIDFCLNSLSTKQRAVVQLPTGAGKSLVLLKVAEAWLRNRGRVYLIAPSAETVYQLRTLAARLGFLAELDIAERSASPFAPFVISTYNCAWLRCKQRSFTNTLCIFDECHHINYAAPVNQSILNCFTHAIGLSATPWSIGCLKFFNHNLYIYKLSSAISEGVNSEYQICPWSEPSSGAYQIIYTNRTDSLAAYCQRLRACDYAIWARKDARNIISKFRQGIVGTIVVNRMLTEGFDQPEIKQLWIAKNTRSRIAMMQMAGRALRPFQNKRARIFIANATLRTFMEKALRRAG